MQYTADKTFKLTVPWEDAVDEAYERKKLRYAQLATEAEQRGWRVWVYPMEMGCQGVVAHSTTRFRKDVGFSGQELRCTVKNLSEAGERSSNWIWLKRKNSGWGSQAKEKERNDDVQANDKRDYGWNESERERWKETICGIRHLQNCYRCCDCLAAVAADRSEILVEHRGEPGEGRAGREVREEKRVELAESTEL
ncbi:UNVERIFIED_CONTAM: hypothetical protein FKN15_067039 [Acipenser sinensis]